MKSNKKQMKDHTSGNPPDASPKAGDSAASNATKKRPLLSSSLVSFAIVIALTLFSGIVHGIIDGRWTESEDLIAQGRKLVEAPEKVGEWTRIETQELQGNAVDMLRCYGSVVNVYRHDPTGIDITVAILFGPRGPIAVHTPEVCYSSIGTQKIGKRQVETVRHGKSKDTLWSVKFAKDPSPDATLDVWYGWSVGSGWTASQHPRFWMVDSLYKLQIAGPVGTDSIRPCRDFLTEFLPEIESLMH